MSLLNCSHNTNVVNVHVTATINVHVTATINVYVTATINVYVVATINVYVIVGTVQKTHFLQKKSIYKLNKCDVVLNQDMIRLKTLI